MPKTEKLDIRVTENAIKAVDSLRGGWSRAEYVRQALSAFVTANRRGPKVSDL